MAQILDTPSDQALATRYINFQILWELLEGREFVSDQDYEYLIYRPQDETYDFSNTNDFDLQNAIDHYCSRGLRVLDIKVVTPDAVG